MSEELKPCPFCGGDAIDATGKYPGSHAIYCSNQPTCCGNRSMYTVEEWNTRALTPKQQCADELFYALEKLVSLYYGNDDQQEAGDYARFALSSLAKARGEL